MQEQMNGKHKHAKNKETRSKNNSALLHPYDEDFSINFHTHTLTPTTTIQPKKAVTTTNDNHLAMG